MKNFSASLLAKLKNFSKEHNLSFQQILVLFLQEEFLRRLSKSIYSENLILKGGFLLYTLSSFSTRPTIDSDYLLNNFPNNKEKIIAMIKQIIENDNNEKEICIELKKIEKISEIKEYQGCRIHLIGKIGTSRTDFYIDLGVGDIIIPAAIKRDISVIISGFEKPKILTYSIESIIAEKLETILNLLSFNSRMKDFYDLYYLLNNYDFEGLILTKAIKKTSLNRNTIININTIESIKNLKDNKNLINRWSIYNKKILKNQISFSKIINEIIHFVQEPINAIIYGEKMNENWEHVIKKWIKK